jgi:hypothetical protein
MTRCLGRLAVLPAMLLMLVGASGYRIVPTRNVILPAARPGEDRGEFTVAKGEIVHVQPVGREVSAILAGEVRLSIAGQQLAIAAGTPLNMARKVEGEAGAALGRAAVFCAPPSAKWGIGDGIANLATLGLFAAGRRFDATVQFCLVDADGDGRVEKAFLAGARRPEDQAAVAIAPTAVAVQVMKPLPGLSEARIRFVGAGGLFGDLAFQLEIVETGTPLFFNNNRYAVSKKKLPVPVELFGARFEVTGYDPGTKTARIRWLRDFPPASYGITTTTTYIPIYVPR